MDKFDVLATSCYILNDSRFIKTPEGHNTYTKAVEAALNIFLSLDNLREGVTAELIYLENESTFARPASLKSFTDAITSYHYAIDILKIITEEPVMYAKYCIPACRDVKTNDKNGIPKDAFCHALTSHKTRLQNNMRSHGISDEDSKIITLRLKNVINMLKMYTDLQNQVMNKNCNITP